MSLEFCLEKESCVSNTLPKREEKRNLIFRMGEDEAKIDFVLIKKNTVLSPFLFCSGGRCCR